MLQELAAFVLSLIQALTPIITAALIYRQVVDARRSKTLETELTAAQTKLNTQGDLIESLKLQQNTNVNRISELKSNADHAAERLQATNDENARLSEAVRKSEAAFNQVSGKLETLQKSYDELKTKSTEDKRADAELIRGLRGELETAHGEARKWHGQADKYEQDWQQQSEAFTRLEGLYKELSAELRALKHKTDQLPPAADPRAWDTVKIDKSDP